MRTASLVSVAVVSSIASIAPASAAKVQNEVGTTARRAVDARFPLARGLDFVAKETPRDDGSVIVALDQVAFGFPVEGRGARVLVDRAGVVRMVFASVETIAPRRALLDAEAAARVAGPFVAEGARLVHLPRPGGARLAWVVEGAVAPSLPSRPVAYVDAESGVLLFRGDRALSAGRVRGFATSPATSELSTFTLDLPTGATDLSTAAWSARSCVDRQAIRTVTSLGPPIDMHLCSIEPAAKPDASSDFLYPRPESDRAVDDPLAETAAAVHLQRAFAVLSAAGIGDLRERSRPITVVVNARNPPAWSRGPVGALACRECPLELLDNAFFSPAPRGFGGALYGLAGDAIFLGQGAEIDYAYDGDVVVHELGHALVASTARLGVRPRVDALGAHVAPGAMNEAIADVLAAIVHGDPRIGEYAGGDRPIRDLETDARCPSAFANEVHRDSLPFSTAIWAARAGAADRARFDRGILLGLAMLPNGEDASFEDLASVLVASVEVEAGEAAAAALRSAFDARVVGCTRVRDLPAESPNAAGFFAYGEARAPSDDDGIVPPGLQFRRSLPEGTTAIEVRFRARTVPPYPAWIGGEPFEPVLLVQFDRPIRWETTGSFRGDQAVARDLGGDPVPSAIVDVPPGAREVYVAVGARGTGDGLYTGLEVLPRSRPVASDAGVDAQADAPPATDDTDPSEALDPLTGRACACAIVGANVRASGIFAIPIVVAIVIGRRRRRR